MRLRVIALTAGLAALVAGPALGTGSGPSIAETIKVLPDLNGTGVKKTTTVFGYQQRFRIVVSGTIEVQSDDGRQNASYDPFFCFKGWCATQSLKIRVAAFAGLSATTDTQGAKTFYPFPTWVSGATSLPGFAYSPQHRYEFVFKCNISTRGCGHLYLRAFPRGQQQPDTTYVGLYTVQITPLGEFEESPADKVVVRFIVHASGKPNVPIKGYASARTLVKSSVDGSGEATFTKQNAAVLVATATKGSITHQDVYSDGTTHRLTFGIVSGTRYYPDLHRLALVLRANDSNDPDCKPEFLIGERFGTLTLLPEADTGGGTAIFFGIPQTKLTGACRHAHGWTRSPAEHVSVRIFVRESTP